MKGLRTRVTTAAAASATLLAFVATIGAGVKWM